MHQGRSFRTLIRPHVTFPWKAARRSPHLPQKLVLIDPLEEQRLGLPLPLVLKSDSDPVRVGGMQ